MKQILLLLICCLSALGVRYDADDKTLAGKVTGVKDGDTIVMLVDGKEVVVRLEGIDCPEKGQAFGSKAKAFTSSIVYGQNARLRISYYDRNKRAVGMVWLSDGRLLNTELLKAGMAWHYKKYNNNPHWAALERNARQQRLGLWSDPHPIEPWLYRKSRTSVLRP